jgi:hypothetical protein
MKTGPPNVLSIWSKYLRDTSTIGIGAIIG